MLIGRRFGGPNGMTLALGFAVVMNVFCLLLFGQDRVDVQRR